MGKSITRTYYHYSDVIIGAMASQITSFTIVYAIVYSGADKKNQSSASLAFVRGIHRWPVNSLHKGPVTRKIFPFDDNIIMSWWYNHNKTEQNKILQNRRRIQKHTYLKYFLLSIFSILLYDSLLLIVVRCSQKHVSFSVMHHLDISMAESFGMLTWFPTSFFFLSNPGPCLSTAIWLCPNHFNQRQRSFQMLSPYWLEGLRQRHVAVVIQSPSVTLFVLKYCLEVLIHY